MLQTERRLFRPGNDATVRQWDLAAGNQLRQIQGHEGAVYQVAFNADGSQIVSGGLDGTVRLWSTVTGAAVKSLAPKDAAARSPVYTLGFSPNGQLIATGGKDQDVRVWNVATGAITQTLTGHPSAVYRVGFNAAGTKLLSCGHSGSVRVWNLADGKPLFDVTAPAVAWSATYAPGGEQVLVTCSNSQAYFVLLPVAAQN